MLARFEEEMMARMDANHEEMMAMIRAWRQTDTKDNKKEAMACQETMEVHLEEEEPTPENMTPEVAHEQEVPVEDAVMPVGEPRKRRRDRRHLAAVCHKKKE
jgi:hypothetical protein